MEKVCRQRKKNPLEKTMC